MAAAPHHAPPETTLAPRNQIHNQQQQNDGEQMEEVDMISTSPVRPKQQTGPISNSQPLEPKKSSQPVKENEVTRTDPQETKHNGHSVEENRDSRTEEDDDPRNPLDEFDWNDFEARYRQAMSEANNDEQAIRDDFERLVQVDRTCCQFLEYKLIFVVFRSMGIISITI